MMKKHLVAVAVSAAFTVPAFAQNVTISGLFDTGFVQRDSGNATGGKFVGASNNILTTSNLAIRASEDLGGGMKVSATIFDEIQLVTNRTSTLAAGSDNQTNTGAPFQAIDQFSLAISGDFGTVEAGRFPSLARSINGAGSVIGNIGLPGSYGRNTAVAAAGNNAAIVAATNTSMRTLGNYATNSAAYTTPTFSGLQAQVFNTFSQSAVGDLNRTIALGVRYTNGPLVAGYSSIKTDVLTTGVKAETESVSLQYDAGVAKFGAALLEHDERSDTVGEDGRVAMITATVPLGGGLSVFGGYHLFEDQAATAANQGKAIMVGVSKDLSKRTTLYAVYAKITNETNASYNLSIHDVGQPAVGNDPVAFAIGLRHSF